MITVSIKWKDNSKNETGFEVQRCQGATCNNFATIATTPPNTTTYTDTAVIASTTYLYRVRALKGKGKSNFSNVLSVTTPGTTIPTLTITCPSNLNLNTNSTGGKVVNYALPTVTGGVTPYNITMNPPSGYTFPVGTTTVNAQVIDAVGNMINCSFTITVNFVDVVPPPPPPNLAVACPANIIITATNGNGIVVNYTTPTGTGGTPPYSIVSTPASGSVFPVGVTQVHCTITDSLGLISTCSFNITVNLAIPADPSSLTANANTNGTVALAWTDNAINETGYVIERKLSTGTVFVALITVPTNTTAYTDNTVSRGLIYNYRVKAINSGGSSGYSNTATVSIVPAAPTNLQAAPGNTSVTLGWNSVANVTYTVKRGTVNGGPYGTTVVSGLATTGYTNTGLSNGTTYYYIVLSVNAAGTSSNSNQASATPQAVLPDANWYISPTGSDSNSGLTPATPFLTWEKAASVITPGQILGTRGGNFSERIISFTSGNSSNPITIKNYNSETTTIKPLVHDNNHPSAIWMDGNFSYIIFDGINIDTTVSNENAVSFPTHNGNDPHHLTWQNAIAVVGDVAGSGALNTGGHVVINQTGFNTFRNFEVSGGGITASPPGNYGVYLAGPNNLVEGFNIHDTTLGGFQIYNGAGDPSDNNIVRNGTIHDIIIAPAPDSRYWGILVDGNNNLIANVICYDNNEPYINGGSAAFSQYRGTGNSYQFCLAVNNTGLGGFNISNIADGTKIQNCISFQNVFDSPIDNGTNSVINHNLIGIDPLFVNISTHNYHLLTGSPARGIGLYNNAVPADFDGVARANPPDIGPYQFV